MKPSLLAFVSFAVAGTVAAVAGCSITGEAFSGPQGHSVVPYMDGGEADAAATIAPGNGASSSGGGASDAATWGNPLCRVATAYGDGGLYGCNPDQPATPIDCAMDGGASSDGGTGYACRVQPSTQASMGSPTTPATACSPSSGDALDGIACKTSDDCAATYDCVGTPGVIGTPGVCRQYCCSGNSACAMGAFCDVQPLAQASATPIPVCMPIVQCNLHAQLDRSSPATCSETQTCAVVREDGETGCVDIGGKLPGESCERDHCAKDLVCLGAPGQRICYKLCDTQSGTQCAAPETCQGGLPLFQDPSVGVCRQ